MKMYLSIVSCTKSLSMVCCVVEVPLGIRFVKLRLEGTPAAWSRSLILSADLADVVNTSPASSHYPHPISSSHVRCLALQK